MGLIKVEQIKEMINILSTIGWSILGVSSIFGLSSVYMEAKAHEPKYMFFMKLSSIGIGIGGALVGISAI